MWNITSKSWCLKTGEIWCLKTNLLKLVSDIDYGELPMMHEREFDRKCAVAFSTGHWPRGR